MQSSTGQYSTQAGEPAHPVQHSVITASSFGFFFRGVAKPLDFGSNLSSSGTIPTALVALGAAGMEGIIPQKLRATARPKRYSAPQLVTGSSNPPASFCYSERHKRKSVQGQRARVPAPHTQRSTPWQERVSTGFN